MKRDVEITCKSIYKVVSYDDGEMNVGLNDLNVKDLVTELKPEILDCFEFGELIEYLEMNGYKVENGKNID